MLYRATFLRNVRTITRQLAALLACGLGCAAGAESPQDVNWSTRLVSELARVDAGTPARLGVFVRDLNTGTTASYRGEQRWYLASMVKVPIAITVLRGVEAGHFTLDTKVTLRASDYVDGAGSTNSHAVGTALSVRSLMEQMIIHSDNTASDMLIDLVGIGAINDVVESLVPKGFQRITSLSDIRRMIYGKLVPDASQLSGRELVLLNRERADADRLQLLGRLSGTPVSAFKMASLDAAYSSYYASGLNSGGLDAYADLLVLLADGKALTPQYTDYLMTLMDRVATGTRRLKAGLPHDVQFAHKTGTQRGRICDAGLARVSEAGQERRVVIVACTRDELSLERSEAALMQVGAAICRSGLLTRGIIDAPNCHILPATTRSLPAAAGR